MLSRLRRWLSPSPRVAAGNAVEPWAQAQGLQYRKVRDSGGFVIEGETAGLAWRAEWGPASRSFITGNELRLIGELGIHRDIQVLVINRHLAEVLEKGMFDQFVEGVQTRIDTEVPPEARWLVMFPKLTGAELKTLRERWVALASVKPWLQRWLAGALTPALEALAARLAEDAPVALSLSRGRLTVRTALAEATPQALADWRALFEVAMAEARRVHEEMPDAASARGNPLPTGWGSSTVSGDLGPPSTR